MLSLYLTLIDTEEDKLRFTDLYERYRHLMFYVAQDMLKDEHLAEDAVQEAFLRIAKNFHKVGEINCPRTRNFSVIIVRNTAITIADKRNSLVDLNTHTENDVFTGAEDVFETVSGKLLTEGILELPEIYRDPLYLHHIYGYTLSEVSGLMNIPVETAKKRVQRARGMLKKWLEKEGYQHE